VLLSVEAAVSAAIYLDLQATRPPFGRTCPVVSLPLQIAVAGVGDLGRGATLGTWPPRSATRGYNCNLLS
jgi:hypothetical protein